MLYTTGAGLSAPKSRITIHRRYCKEFLHGDSFFPVKSQGQSDYLRSLAIFRSQGNCAPWGLKNRDFSGSGKNRSCNRRGSRDLVHSAPDWVCLVSYKKPPSAHALVFGNSQQTTELTRTFCFIFGVSFSGWSFRPLTNVSLQPNLLTAKMSAEMPLLSETSKCPESAGREDACNTSLDRL